MKQTLMVGIFLCLFYTISHASVGVSDSSDYPVMQEFTKTSIVGGFSLLSLFEESESFAQGTWVLHLGSGFKTDVAAEITGLKKKIPPVYLLLEKSIMKNIGLGIKVGYRLWNVPKLDYQYQYYLGSIRGTYHFNVHPKVDPYLGVSALVRIVVSTGNQPQETNRDINYGVFIGCRYYLKSKFGVFAEYGGGGLTHFHGGLFFKLR